VGDSLVTCPCRDTLILSIYWGPTRLDQPRGATDLSPQAPLVSEPKAVGHGSPLAIMGAETDGGEQTRGLRSVRGRAAVPVTGYTGELKVFFLRKKEEYQHK
jgi:hypothetical protein